MPYSLTDMALYFFMYSFCGWLMETVLCSFQEKRFPTVLPPSVLT